MSRVLILSWDGGGNTPSAFNLGARLVRRGHRVRMMGWDSMAARAAAAGLEFTTYPSVAPWPADLRHEDGWDRIAAALFGAATEADVAAEAESFRADVVVIDCMLTAGHAAAHRLGLPVASLVHVRYAPFVHGWGSEVLGTDVGALLDAAQCVLALQPPGFDPPELLQGRCHAASARCFGPAPRRLSTRPPRRCSAEPGDPWVLLSLSTTLQGQAEALPGLLDALASLPVRVLLTLGGVLTPDTVPAPANVTVARVPPARGGAAAHGRRRHPRRNEHGRHRARGRRADGVRAAGTRPAAQRGAGAGTRRRADGATRRATGRAGHSSTDRPRREPVRGPPRSGSRPAQPPSGTANSQRIWSKPWQPTPSPPR